MIKPYEEEIIKRFNLFLDKYEKKYNTYMMEYIKKNILLECLEPTTADVLMQVYDEIDLNEILQEAVKNGELDKSFKNSFYLEHLKKLQENFNINCNVLDVASGVIPAFANNIAKAQLNMGIGTVSVYDPRLVVIDAKHSNMKLYPLKFSNKTDIRKYDLLTGIFPCEATKIIIEKACQEKKNFYVAMCGCTHFSDEELASISMNFYNFCSPKYYQELVINMTEKLLKEYDNGKLVVDRLDGYYDIDYPILYNKK